MNSNKWRTISLPVKMVEDLIASHLYAMRGMSKREIVEMELPSWMVTDNEVKIKIKMKEDNKSVDQSDEK